MPSLFGIGQKLFVEAPEACFEVCCSLGLGFIKRVCGVSFYTAKEVEEVESLKTLARSVMKKSPKFVNDPAICGGIKDGSMKALSTFKNNLPVPVRS